MPRDGSGVYSAPAGTTATPNTTILSANYNALVNDLVSDANAARPVTAGGTGGATAMAGHDGVVTKGSDVASAATLNLNNATGAFVDITGTTTVTAVTLSEGKHRMARAVSAFQLTASASLVVNGSTSVNYTTTAGDLLFFEGYSSSVVRVWTVTGGGSSIPYTAASSSGAASLQFAEDTDNGTNKVTLQGPASTSDVTVTLPDMAGKLGTVEAFSGALYGLTLSNNGSDATNDIDIAVGIALDSTNAEVIKLGSSITKRLDATWAVGTNQGGLDTGSIANTTYHVWLIKRSDTGVVDALFSTSASAPTMPTNYDYKRRIGSIIRTGGAIKAFYQRGDDFVWATPSQDVNTTNPGSSAQTITLTVPSGIVVKADISAETSNPGSNHYIFFSPTAVADQAASASVSQMSVNGTVRFGVGNLQTYTNTSAQIRARWSASGASDVWVVNTNGYRDDRGRI